ncbi:putative E3 ubiquitin-protein ligase [Pseudocercospora fuligena]|uniref:Putative E3 ubiquitin-protein ligase n=1 Tax=Pseudocercospora fuligena TaxID=685502 RepID=A0A8H6VHZ7_9PEZI|nr:putative E3 ubiquitin-protein ligase [Pseudocercospora fuligena]
MTMAQQSHLSRYHPAVLSIAGIGAAYGIYALYSTYSQRPAATSLHRSNAVHRPRRERPNRLESSAPTADAPLGTVSLTRNGHDFAINLATTQVPGGDQFRSMFGPGTEDVRHEVQCLVLHTVLFALANSRRDSETWSIAEDFGLRDLLSALHTRQRSREEILRAAWDVRRVMNLDTLTPEHVGHEVDFLLAAPLRSTDTGSGSGSGSNSDSDARNSPPAETEDLDAMSSANREPSQGLRGMLYYIAEDNAKRNAYEHRGIHCEECGIHPITGIRWHCLNCPDYDLCSSCETHTRHPKTHVFAKIKIPLPLLSQPTKEYRIWYPGDPRRVHSSLDPLTRKRLGSEHDFEEPQMDALYDQFLTIANVPWENDPCKVRAAIDRRAFNKALTSERWPGGFATNAMFDRMFAFYDTDSNGIIGFDEFLSGMAYLRGPRRYATLSRTLQGYDVDGNGYVDRKDILRLLHAKYIIQKQLVNDSIDSQQMDLTQSSMEILRTSQPISSIFTQEEIPPGETRRPRGKEPDVHGDMQPLPTTKALLDEDDPYTTSVVPAAHERLRNQLLRFEDMIAGVDRSDELTSSYENGNNTNLHPPSNDASLSQVLDVPRLFPDHEYEVEVAYMQDALWHVVEQGFNDLLDRLFKDKEEEDEMIMSTREERARWREQIDAQAAADRSFREQLIATAATDPLMATAMDSYNGGGNNKAPPQLPERPARGPFSDQPIPTDWDGLTRREAEISNASLDELLNATGYSMRGDADRHSSQSMTLDTWDSSTADEKSSTSESDGAPDDSFDPTLPQNRPNSEEQIQSKVDRTDATAIAAESNPPTAPPPNNRRLQFLSGMDSLEQELDERGGPGRLSYDEIERITVADSRGELRGLVKSWLEWAAF